MLGTRRQSWCHVSNIGQMTDRKHKSLAFKAWLSSMIFVLKEYFLSYIYFLIKEKNEHREECTKTPRNLGCSPKVLTNKTFLCKHLLCVIYMNFKLYCTEYSCLFNEKRKFLPHVHCPKFPNKTGIPGKCAYPMNFCIVQYLAVGFFNGGLTQFEKHFLFFPLNGFFRLYKQCMLKFNKPKKKEVPNKNKIGHSNEKSRSILRKVCDLHDPRKSHSCHFCMKLFCKCLCI